MARNPYYNPPRFSAPSGEFEVDYRSHDGTILLGQDDWSFETKWTTSGPGSIQFYSDGAGVVCVGVAPGAQRIDQVSCNVYQAADFSSRVRRPRNGSVVLVENDKGFAAAIQIDEVTVADDGEPGAMLRASYQILRDRSRDFSVARWGEIAKLAESARREIELAEEAERESALNTAPIGIGHNQPPDALRLEAADTKERLRVLVANAQNRILQPEEISEHADHLAGFSSRVRAHVVSRIRMIEEGIYNEIGAAAVRQVIGRWESVADLASRIVELLGALF